MFATISKPRIMKLKQGRSNPNFLSKFLSYHKHNTKMSCFEVKRISKFHVVDHLQLW